jgi:MOSC domain-containing protein YiiM
MDQIRDGLRGALEGRRGMLARVVAGGLVRVGDPIEVVE